MKIRIKQPLRYWIDRQWQVELASNEEQDRDALLVSILTEFVRGGDAERYVRRDGTVGWRATPRFLEWLVEAEQECRAYDG